MDILKIKEEKTILELLNFCIISLDKPAGITSFECAEKIREILDVKKTGHFGTLDINVTGVLPVALNRACKLSNFFMKKDKEYIGKFKLHKEISKAELEKEMKKFIGDILQKPPVKSNVKRVLRKRKINNFKILNKDGKIVFFHADVEAGTYIRKLISDLGNKIGGAQMIELKRIRAGIFNEKKIYTFNEIEKAFIEYKKGNENNLREILIPAEIISEIIPEIQVKEESVIFLLNGKPLMKKDILKPLPNSKFFSVFYKNQFIEIAKKVESLDIIAKPVFVLN